jgi:hypothetical protein
LEDSPEGGLEALTEGEIGLRASLEGLSVGEIGVSTGAEEYMELDRSGAKTIWPAASPGRDGDMTANLVSLGYMYVIMGSWFAWGLYASCQRHKKPIVQATNTAATIADVCTHTRDRKRRESESEQERERERERGNKKKESAHEADKEAEEGDGD